MWHAHPMSHTTWAEAELAGRADICTTPCLAVGGEMPAKSPGEMGIFTDCFY